MAQTFPTPVVRIAELEMDPAQLDAYRAFLTEEIETSVTLEPDVLSLWPSRCAAVSRASASWRSMPTKPPGGAPDHAAFPQIQDRAGGHGARARSARGPVLTCAKRDDGVASRCRSPWAAIGGLAALLEA